MDELRRLPSPGYYSSIGRRGLLDGVFWTCDEKWPDISGPFETEADFNKAMRSKYLSTGQAPAKADFYKDAFPVVFQGHPPVFSHGDFQRKDIIVQRVLCVPNSAEGGSPETTASQTLQEDSFKLTLFDWEFSGRYPVYWTTL
jgi:hypothetical protein